MRRGGQGRWVRGIIDQLQLDGAGRLQVVEHKTRASPTLPRAAQARRLMLLGYCSAALAPAIHA